MAKIKFANLEKFLPLLLSAYSKIKTGKQVISMLLCLALVMSYMPMTSLVVHAAENNMESDITVNEDETAELAAPVVTPSEPVKTTDKYDMNEDGENDEVYEIGTAAEFYWFAGLVNGTLEGVESNGEANAVLTADITVNENLLSSLEFDAEGNVTNGENFAVWEPIGNYETRYSGIFDGNSHTVSGLYFNNKEAQYVGMFGYSDVGEIRNVTVADSYFFAGEFVGGVLGYNSSGIVKNCNNAGEVTGTSDDVGGVLYWGVTAVVLWKIVTMQEK